MGEGNLARDITTSHQQTTPLDRLCGTSTWRQVTQRKRRLCKIVPYATGMSEQLTPQKGDSRRDIATKMLTITSDQINRNGRTQIDNQTGAFA
ncbi:hypothetical protein L686_23045 [Stutzerimonas stutzeri MF28]|nr:hypothetical protein L686_23045 [Stutzerimonas stutzeri MF28]